MNRGTDVTHRTAALGVSTLMEQRPSKSVSLFRWRSYLDYAT
ncbi:hypothetical protein OAK50_03115 [Verrucomicrobiales bacterium]|nr:hypothetical protein [Verrucomicrobiales bacterium]